MVSLVVKASSLQSPTSLTNMPTCHEYAADHQLMVSTKPRNRMLPTHTISEAFLLFSSNYSNLWFRSIDLWPLPLSYLTCPNQQIYNKIYQDKIVCTAAITSCGNGSAWALALSLLDEMPRQLAMPDVSSCPALGWSKKVQAQWIECNWNTLGNIEEWIFPKNICQTNTKIDFFLPNLEVSFRVGFLKETLGDVLFGSTCWFCKGVVRVASLMVATGAACCPSISMS